MITSQDLSISDLSFVELMTLEPHGPDTFVGLAPRYPWGGRLFGGQVVAQAVRAAQFTVPEGYFVHSVHSYFIRGGTPAEPVRFEVDRIRNGRSFVTRRVVARQSNGAILNLSASFQIEEEASDVQTMEPPLVAGPNQEEDFGWGNMLQRNRVLEEKAHTVTWMRMSQDIPEELASVALLFLSDASPSGAVRATHPASEGSMKADREKFMVASLDHTVYFHRSVDPADWLLVDQHCHGLVGNRGLAVGSIFCSEGIHVASVVQEVLLRENR